MLHADIIALEARNVLDMDAHVESWDIDLQLMSSVRRGIWRHTLPTVQLGFGKGRSTLGHIFQSVMHAFWLIAAHDNDHTLFADVVRSISARASGLGTESGLARVRPIPLQEAFPYMLAMDEEP